MRNVMMINASGGLELLSSTNTGDNSLIINGTIIDPADWVGSGEYTFTISDIEYTIVQASDSDGNWQLIQDSAYEFHFEKLFSIGGVVQVDSGSTACSSGQYKKIGSVFLGPGVWVLTVAANFPSVNTTGRRRTYVTTTGFVDGTTTGPAVYAVALHDIQAPISGNQTITHGAMVVTVPEGGQTFWLVGNQTSGESMDVSGRMYAVKVSQYQKTDLVYDPYIDLIASSGDTLVDSAGDTIAAYVE